MSKLTVQKVLNTAVTLPYNTLSLTATNPLLSGALLYILTRGPPQLRERLLSPFRSTLLATNPVERIAKLVTVLKVLVAVGVVGRVNDALDSLARNYWTLGRRGEKYVWDGHTEVVLITGGCSGFGYEMVKSFAGKAKVVVLDVSPMPGELERLKGVHYWKCDVSNWNEIEDVVGKIKREVGVVTVLVNNAGIGHGKVVLETTAEQFDKLIKINLTSHFVLIKEFLPGMLEKKKGHIVGIASMASFVAAPGLLDYCCSKVGVLYLNDGIRAELLTRYKNGHCINTTVVHPSWHDTGIIKDAKSVLKKHGIVPDPASNVSDLVVEQVLKERSGQIFVPKSQKAVAGLRSRSLWLQDVLSGYVFKKKGFQFGEDDDSQLSG